MDFWYWLMAQPPADIVLYIFTIVGWALLALVFFYMGAHFWAKYRGSLMESTWEWIVLAVDVPPLYIQTPKAVEQIFAHLSGAQVSIHVMDKYWTGKRQKSFSFEIISIEGYIQFLIRTEAGLRDLVEAAIYAQYPEAEITEVEDYVSMAPDKYPSDTHHMFGVEFQLQDADAYPIRTYTNFEYKISKDEVFSDPMAAILENFSRIGHGEHFWLQIILEPTGSGWKEKGIELIKSLIAGDAHGHGGGVHPFLHFLGDIPLSILKNIFTNINGTEFEPVEAHEEEHAGKISDMTPGEKSTIEAMEEKIAKIGFKTKMRALYVARNEVFDPGRCVDGFIGALNQFHIQSRNAIVPRMLTHTHFLFFNHSREIVIQNKFFKAFAKRKLKTGGNPYILNIEELATVWHFPLPFVKTPLIQKAGAKRGEPPINLPIEADAGPLRAKVKNVEPPPEAEAPKDDEPDELMYG